MGKPQALTPPCVRTADADRRPSSSRPAARCAAGATSALPFETNDAHDVTAAVSQLRAALGDDAFNAAVSEGVSLSEAELVHFVQTRITAHNA